MTNEGLQRLSELDEFEMMVLTATQCFTKLSLGEGLGVSILSHSVGYRSDIQQRVIILSLNWK
jgi:hypothetical protein